MRRTLLPTQKKTLNTFLKYIGYKLRKNPKSSANSPINKPFSMKSDCVGSSAEEALPRVLMIDSCHYAHEGMEPQHQLNSDSLKLRKVDNQLCLNPLPLLFSFPETTPLNSRGGSTSRPSSSLISPKVCTRASFSVAPYRLESNNALWSLSNTPATKGSSKHPVLPPRRHSLFELIFHCPPRRQSLTSDRPRQLSHNGTLFCSLCLQSNWRRGPEAKQLTMAPKRRALCPTHKRANCFSYVKLGMYRGV
ncbi:hypothetical protein TNCV_2655501 [Trichonephila clavipes]|nr:hypothetical protein TNCV_2655501 [Trichonephila clavipes]